MKTVDLVAIIVKTMQYDNKRYLYVERLAECVKFCRKRFNELNLSLDYLFPSLDTPSIKSVVFFNNDIFKLDTDEDIIYLRDGVSLPDLANKCVGDILNQAIQDFCDDNRFPIPFVLSDDVKKIVDFYTERTKAQTLEDVLRWLDNELTEERKENLTNWINDIKKSLAQKYKEGTGE